MKHCIFYFILGEVEDKFTGLCYCVLFKQGTDCGLVHGETVRCFFRKSPVLGALHLNKKTDIICNILFEIWHISLIWPVSSGGQSLTETCILLDPYLQLLQRTWSFLLSLVNWEGEAHYLCFWVTTKFRLASSSLPLFCQQREGSPCVLDNWF